MTLRLAPMHWAAFEGHVFTQVLEQNKLKEIKNGRLAMLAFVGFVAQQAATGKVRSCCIHNPPIFSGTWGSQAFGRGAAVDLEPESCMSPRTYTPAQLQLQNAASRLRTFCTVAYSWTTPAGQLIPWSCASCRVPLMA